MIESTFVTVAVPQPTEATLMASSDSGSEQMFAIHLPVDNSVRPSGTVQCNKDHLTPSLPSWHRCLDT